MNVKLEAENVSSETIIFKFPRDLNFINATGYINAIDNNNYMSDILFDLDETESIHSSFIGFLINTKQNLNKKGKKLHLSVSPVIKKLLKDMDLYNYLQA